MWTNAHSIMSLRSQFPTVSVIGCSCCRRSSLGIDCSCCSNISLSVLPIGACVFGLFACGCCLVCAGHGANGVFV